MKKTIFSFVALAAFALMTSCSSSSDSGGTPPPTPTPVTPAEAFANQYFTVEGGTFVEGTMPAASAGATALENVAMNDRALASGANFINISTSQAIQSFLVGIQGVPGYVQIPAVARAVQSYSLPVVYGAGYHSDITVIVEGVTTDGHVTLPFSQVVRFVESAAGDLHINLTFDNAKDIDLHLIMPDGHRIYYADRTITTGEGAAQVSGGLDHDSNAACNIDNLNNENIVLPAALIAPGKYKVQINMWSNCDASVFTQWTVTARMNGAFIQNEMTLPTAAQNQQRIQDKDTDINSSYATKNPVSGTYPVGSPSCGDGGYSTVMEFTIGGAAAPELRYIYKPTDMDQMKMEEAAWKRNAK